MNYTLSDEQEQILSHFVRGKNLFITGPGGVGKSFIIKKLVELGSNITKLNGKKKKVQVCATTGTAATLLQCNATTINSWGRIKLASGDIEKLSDEIAKDNKRKWSWIKTDILIVDEVSMMSKKVFELLNLIGQKCRCNEKMFGGLQVVFLADFYQLPPVGNYNEVDTQKFCFESPVFKTTFPPENCFELTKIYRQKDKVYSNICNEVRIGQLTEESKQILNGRVGLNIKENCGDVIPTILFSRRQDVMNTNRRELFKLKGEEKLFLSKNVSIIENETKMQKLYKKKQFTLTKQMKEYEWANLRKGFNGDGVLKLKKGAQVMCIANLDLNGDKPICNGSRGIVIAFEDNNPVVKFNNGVERVMTPYIWESEKYPVLGISQIPLILAWAITIHKSQGASIDLAQMSLGDNIFAPGQIYVALSRIRSLEGLYLTNFNHSKIKINEKVKKFYESIKASSSSTTLKGKPKRVVPKGFVNEDAWVTTDDGQFLKYTATDGTIGYVSYA